MPIVLRFLIGCLMLFCMGCQNLQPAEPVSQKAGVIVVGGGLAGLATAYELQKRGIQVLLLEEADTLGGRIATAYYPSGAQAEYGLQEFWAGNPALDLAKELGLPLDEGAGDAYSSVIIDGKLYPYVQEHAVDYLASFLTTAEQAELRLWLQQASQLRMTALTAGLRVPAIRELQALSFAEWIRRGKVSHKVSEFVRLLIECELAESWDRFSALAGLIEFAPFLEGGAKNYHIQGGNYRLIEALRDRLTGSYITSARVIRLERSAGADATSHVTVTYQKGRRLEHAHADAVVVAIPHARIHALSMHPPLSPAKQEAIASLGRGQYLVVHLIVDLAAGRLWREHGRSPFPILTSGPLGVICGMRAEGKGDASTDVFTLLIHGPAAHALHMRTHDEIVAAVATELDRLWPGFTPYCHNGYVYNYHPAGVAVWPPGRSPLDAGMQSLSEPEQGLYFVGDWLLGAHSDGAVISAQRTAKRIAQVMQGSR